LKVKRCCGVDGVRRSQEAFDELYGAAFCFPRLRPVSAGFDAWAETAPDELSRALFEAGGTALGPAERDRITSVLALESPDVWAGVVRDFGTEEDAMALLLLGAIVAGLEERSRALDPQALELIEPDDEPVDALALVLEARDLWSVVESGHAVEAFDAGESLQSIADRLWTDWHGERLEVLVARVRGRLPLDERPVASAALERACAAFASDERLARRLRAELLLDSFPSMLDLLAAAA
jgi:hypothetical protein